MAKQPRSFLPAKAGPKVVPWLWANDEWHERLPALYELLSAGIYEGEERKPASLSLFVAEGRLKACIRDRQTRQALWLTLEGKMDVLSEIEALLQSGGGEWRSFEKDPVKAPF